MALVSPGVQVTIIDESQYLSSAPGSVPLILLATAENKANGEGTGAAAGTLATNANKLYRLTSQRDLTTIFGNPFFYKTINGTPLQGYELNEYGLLTTFSLLGTTNLCYVLRADIDLASLVGRTSRPSGSPPNGTYWLDINQLSSVWGIHEFNKTSGTFTFKSPIIINDSADLVNGSTGNGSPLPNIGNVGDYAVTFLTDAESNRTQATKPDLYSTYWFKAPVYGEAVPASQWVALGSPEWLNSWPVVQSTRAPLVEAVPTFDEDGIQTDPGIDDKTLVINGVEITLAVDDDLSIIVNKINSANVPFVSAKSVADRLELYMSNTVGFDIASNISFIGSTGSLEDDLGIDLAKTYSPVELKYGTNAQRPASWTYSTNEGRPTGSVWIKTNAAGNGANLVVRQYNSVTNTYTALNCPISTSDWNITNQLDSSGGKNIPTGAVYAQYGFDGASFNTPVQFYRKNTSGPSVFSIAIDESFVFNNTSIIDIWVSVPGSASLDGPYSMVVNSGNTVTGTNNGTTFVGKWQSLEIPNTTISFDSGVLTIVHTEGGVVILDDKGVSNSAVAQLGLNPGNTATSFIKWGPYKYVTYNNVAHPTLSSGAGATFTIRTYGKTVDLIEVTSSGSGYLNGNDGELMIELASGVAGAQDTYKIKVDVVQGEIQSGSAVWVNGFARPQYMSLMSTWTPVNFIPSTIAPVVYPDNETKWYYSAVNQVDIMVNFNGSWKGYRNVSFDLNGLATISDSNNPSGQTDSSGIIISASTPESQTDGTPLVYGDLWLDTSDLENYPVINRWQNVSGINQWVKIDNTDQTSENGIVFADARWGTNGTEDPIFDALPNISSMLTSNYVDPDIIDSTLYPQGTLLFNTRRSGYNVKEFRLNYFNTSSFPDATLPQETSTWVTVSGNKVDGSPYMGRKAQRVMIVSALKQAIDSNSQIREEDTFFNLIAAPGYPELQPNLVSLNNERNQTSYIVGDTPMRLKDDANDIVAWATNAAGATSTGEEGLVTRDTYMGLYYPSGIANDPTGSEVAVPSSHMILRTMIYNDTVAYPWFAPAGQRRGIIDNANNIGYIDSDTGEFVTIKNRSALRDAEYTNFINPIAYFTNLGLLNFGNKNSFDSQSALDRTNVSRLICYLRWNIQRALRPFIFEPNDNITRAQVKSVAQTLLADIQTKRGIYDYLVVCDESNNTPARIDRNELWVDIAVEPVKAAEFIYVPVRILNTGEISGG